MHNGTALHDHLRAWTYRRQLLGQSGASGLEALRRLVGVYSSHPTAPLSLACRAPLTADAFKALEEGREAIRIPGMRGSNFLVPVDLAPRVFAATLYPMEKHAFRFKTAGITPEEYEALKPRLIDAAQEPVTAKVLQERVPVEGKLPTIARIMCIEGLMLRVGGSLRSDNLSYVATEAWLGDPLEQLDQEPSLAWLAEAYLRAFGPARIADVAWWIGIPKGKAKTALAGAKLTDIGEGNLIPDDLVDAFNQVEPVDPEAIDLLPKWDALTMGLAGDGRRRFLNDEHRALAYVTKTGGQGSARRRFPARAAGRPRHRQLEPPLQRRHNAGDGFTVRGWGSAFGAE